MLQIGLGCDYGEFHGIDAGLGGDLQSSGIFSLLLRNRIWDVGSDGHNLAEVGRLRGNGRMKFVIVVCRDSRRKFSGRKVKFG